jgi:hypothetical protein
LPPLKSHQHDEKEMRSVMGGMWGGAVKSGGTHAGLLISLIIEGAV